MPAGVLTILNRFCNSWSTNTMDEITRSKIQASNASKATYLENAHDNFDAMVTALSFDAMAQPVDAAQKNTMFTSENEIKEFLRLVAESKPASLYHRKLADDTLNQNNWRSFLKKVVLETELLPANAIVCVFVDELNTAHSLGMITEAFMTHSLDGIPLPPNIFFCGASTLITHNITFNLAVS